VSAWVAVRLVPVVRLITFPFPAARLQDHDDGALSWLRPARDRARAGTGGAGAAGEARGWLGRLLGRLPGRLLE
jgi:hypothetical protein